MSESDDTLNPSNNQVKLAKVEPKSVAFPSGNWALDANGVGRHTICQHPRLSTIAKRGDLLCKHCKQQVNRGNGLVGFPDEFCSFSDCMIFGRAMPLGPDGYYDSAAHTRQCQLEAAEPRAYERYLLATVHSKFFWQGEHRRKAEADKAAKAKAKKEALARAKPRPQSRPRKSAVETIGDDFSSLLSGE